MKNKKLKKSIFKLDDKVYDIHFGWGEVVKIIDSRWDYPIVVNFSNSRESYTANGEFFKGVKTLSFTEYTLNGFSQERPKKNTKLVPIIRFDGLFHYYYAEVREYIMDGLGQYDVIYDGRDKKSEHFDTAEEALAHANKMILSYNEIDETLEDLEDYPGESSDVIEYPILEGESFDILKEMSENRGKNVLSGDIEDFPTDLKYLIKVDKGDIDILIAHHEKSIEDLNARIVMLDIGWIIHTGKPKEEHIEGCKKRITELESEIVRLRKVCN